uniref:t-SNARE coiled-coil homology domain-containing protein n=1 Tax=Syphacia muris TaxID=451379 RepID=A0A0N5ANX7_9BILA
YNNSVTPCESSYQYTDDSNYQHTDSLDPELKQQLLLENERFYAKVMHTDSDIQKIEKQLNEIYKLQESFAEKVLEQGKDIEYVNQETVTTVENICEGNEQIRGAIQNMASRRVILLFCLIALTFTLLFLDWYNP